MCCFPMIPGVSLFFFGWLTPTKGQQFCQVLDPRIGAHHCAHQLGQGGDAACVLFGHKGRWEFNGIYITKMGYST